MLLLCKNKRKNFYCSKSSLKRNQSLFSKLHRDTQSKYKFVCRTCQTTVFDASDETEYIKALICCMEPKKYKNKQNKKPICIHRCSSLATKAQTSLGLIFISIKSVLPKSPFTFLPHCHSGSPSLALCLDLHRFALLSRLHLSLCLPLVSGAAFGVTTPGGAAVGGPTALLSGAFAAVSLQLSACDKESKRREVSTLIIAQ